jgi:hypothetical protein
MEPSFEKLLVRLALAKVDFVLVGGLAVALNGYVRLTEDVDLLVGTAPDNLRRLLDVLAGFGEGHGGTLDPADFTDDPGAIRIIEDSEGCVIDLFTVMSGLSYRDLATDAETALVGDQPIRYASKSALIRLKSGSVREKDQIDVIALRQLMDA